MSINEVFYHVGVFYLNPYRPTFMRLYEVERLDNGRIRLELRLLDELPEIFSDVEALDTQIDLDVPSTIVSYKILGLDRPLQPYDLHDQIIVARMRSQTSVRVDQAEWWDGAEPEVRASRDKERERRARAAAKAKEAPAAPRPPPPPRPPRPPRAQELFRQTPQNAGAWPSFLLGSSDAIVPAEEVPGNCEASDDQVHAEVFALGDEGVDGHGSENMVELFGGSGMADDWDAVVSSLAPGAAPTPSAASSSWGPPSSADPAPGSPS